MRAAVVERYGGPEVVRLREVDEPVIGAGDLLVRVEATTVGPTDGTNRSGRPAFGRLYFGLTRPKRLADGAATPPPKRCSSSSASGCAGTRSPTLESPPVVTSGTRAFFSTSKVSGPGQHASARRSAACDIRLPHAGRASAEARCTING